MDRSNLRKTPKFHLEKQLFPSIFLHIAINPIPASQQRQPINGIRHHLSNNLLRTMPSPALQKIAQAKNHNLIISSKEAS